MSAGLFSSPCPMWFLRVDGRVSRTSSFPLSLPAPSPDRPPLPPLIPHPPPPLHRARSPSKVTPIPSLFHASLFLPDVGEISFSGQFWAFGLKIPHHDASLCLPPSWLLSLFWEGFASPGLLSRSSWFFCCSSQVSRSAGQQVSRLAVAPPPPFQPSFLAVISCSFQNSGSVQVDEFCSQLLSRDHCLSLPTCASVSQLISRSPRHAGVFGFFFFLPFPGFAFNFLC